MTDVCKELIMIDFYTYSVQFTGLLLQAGPGPVMHNLRQATWVGFYTPDAVPVTQSAVSNKDLVIS